MSHSEWIFLIVLGNLLIYLFLLVLWGSFLYLWFFLLLFDLFNRFSHFRFFEWLIDCLLFYLFWAETIIIQRCVFSLLVLAQQISYGCHFDFDVGTLIKIVVLFFLLLISLFSFFVSSLLGGSSILFSLWFFFSCFLLALVSFSFYFSLLFLLWTQ